MIGTAAISIRQLCKRYGSITAVKDLTLEVSAGEVFGFLGLNGAGKTTTIRVLLDLLRATSGEAFIFGEDCRTRGLAARAQIGYLPGEMGVFADLRGGEVLDLLGGLSAGGINHAYRKKLMDQLELPASVLGRKLREYSTGMKRKLGLIQALQCEPRLLILDEPTEGLDPLMQEAFYAILDEWRGLGRTIFMSSHVLSEVERVCDRVAVLRQGELVLLSTVKDARNLAPRRVRVSFSRAVDATPEWPPQYALVRRTADTWELQVEGELGPLLTLLSGLPVRDLAIAEPKLEDVLVKYYRGTAA